MKILASTLIIVLLLASCRGEPVPRDHQNTPSSATSPVDVNPEVIRPQPTYGAEGTSAPYETTTLADPPSTPEDGGVGTELPEDAITTTSGTPRLAPSPTP